MQQKSFCHCDLSEKLLYTAFLILVGIGYLMALVYLNVSHQGHDGKPGVSIQDIAENYYGNRSGTRLESALRGSMKGYIAFEERNQIISWLGDGASKKEYEQKVKPIIDKNCIFCHGQENGKANLSNYEGVSKVADIDTGVSYFTRVKVSHIHLFGIGLVLLGVGMIFRRVQMRMWLKSTLILMPFVAVFIDILAWFLAKSDPHYAYTIVFAGALLGLSLAAQILLSLYQIWFYAEPQ